MDKMHYLKVLSIKMGVFMDKIEFFPTSLGHRGLGGRWRGEGWWGLGRRGRGGDSGGRGQGHRLRRARHWRWTAGGSRERATAEVRGKKSGKKRCNSGKTVNFVLSFANNKGFD